jgi:hypothetical protein
MSPSISNNAWMASRNIRWSSASSGSACSRRMVSYPVCTTTTAMQAMPAAMIALVAVATVISIGFGGPPAGIPCGSTRR